MMKNVLGLITTFDKSNDLRDLTNDRCVGAIPFGGRYRIIDFALSNMINSNITNVGIVLRDQYQSLIDHIGNGKDWDLARKIGGISLLPPYSYSKKGGAFDVPERRGKIEALIGISDFIQTSKCEYVLMTNANLVANIDLSKVIEQHKESQAEITCVCTKTHSVSVADTYFNVDENLDIKDISVSYDNSEFCHYSCLGIYVMSKAVLQNLIPIWASHNMKYFELEGLTLAMRSKMNIKAYIHEGYSKSITDVRRYYDANMDLLSKDVREELFPKKRPIFTKVQDEQPTYYSDKAVACQSLIADGCTLEGTVENSIIFRDVHVEAGAHIKDSVVLQGCKIYENANVSNVIADKNVYIGKEKTMMGHRNYPIVIAKHSVI